MKNNITRMHQLWEKFLSDEKKRTALPNINFNEVISSIFAAGPFYYYIIDFYDMSLSHFSDGFKEAHGIEPEEIESINEVLNLIHPDDLDFVAKAEEKAIDFILNHLGKEHCKEYKISYNFRFKTQNGAYQMYNHQALILTTDEKGNLSKSINIHTNIHHIASKNNKTFSMIGLNGNPSYLNMQVYPDHNRDKANSLSINSFSSREIEIIKLIADGEESNSIADKLFISPETVKTHRKNILRKAGCSSSTVLVARGISEGWI